ncbi:MAG: PspC domain-containing protein [Aeromicrobium sp.]
MSSPTPGSQLDALRRSTDDKLLGGVSGGIARALNIDPVIVRIGFVVLTVAGFAGPILYAACWLLIPAEGSERSVLGEAFDLKSDSQLRTVGLIVAGVIALAAVLGDTTWGLGGWFWWPLWILVWLAVPVALAVLLWRLVTRSRQQPAPPQFAPPPPYQPAPAAGTFAASGDPTTSLTGDDEMTTPLRPDASDTHEPTTDEPTTVLDDPGPPGTPPGPPPTPVMPPARPRQRWSPALLLLTLSAIIAALGALGLWSVTQEPLDAAVYPAVALGIVAAGLFVGTRIGHPGALVPLGVLLIPVLAVASVAPNLSAGEIDLRPTTAAAIAEPIEQGFGRVHVDLTSIQDPQTLSGRTLEIDNGVGETIVVVPEGLDVAVDAELSAGGRIQVFDRVTDGQNPSLERPSDAPGAYRIVINGTAGEIQVVRP